MGILTLLFDDTLARLALIADRGSAVPVLKLLPTLGVILDRSGWVLKGTYLFATDEPRDATGARLSNMLYGKRSSERTNQISMELVTQTSGSKCFLLRIQTFERHVPRKMQDVVAAMYTHTAPCTQVSTYLAHAQHCTN